MLLLYYVIEVMKELPKGIVALHKKKTLELPDVEFSLKIIDEYNLSKDKAIDYLAKYYEKTQR